MLADDSSHSTALGELKSIVMLYANRLVFRILFASKMTKRVVYGAAHGELKNVFAHFDSIFDLCESSLTVIFLSVYLFWQCMVEFFAVCQKLFYERIVHDRVPRQTFGIKPLFP